MSACAVRSPGRAGTGVSAISGTHAEVKTMLTNTTTTVALLLLPFLLLSLAAASLAGGLPAGDAPAGPRVEVPLHPNPTCPIMGKPISARLHVDTELGRIWVCCKGCIADIVADPETAYRTAYPRPRELANARCPVTGRAIEKDAPRMALQGLEFSVCHADCEAEARADSQAVVAKLHAPELSDAYNRLCPITGAPVVPDALVVVDRTLVRLSSTDVLDRVRADPRGVLTRVEALAAPARHDCSEDHR